MEVAGEGWEYCEIRKCRPMCTILVVWNYEMELPTTFSFSNLGKRVPKRSDYSKSMQLMLGRAGT